MHTATNLPPSFTLISFDQLCQTLYEATQGVSGDTLLRQYDESARLSYARVSILRAGSGKTYALIQIEDHAARTLDDKAATIGEAVLALIEVSRCRIGELMEHLGLPFGLDTITPNYTLH